MPGQRWPASWKTRRATRCSLPWNVDDTDVEPFAAGVERRVEETKLHRRCMERVWCLPRAPSIPYGAPCLPHAAFYACHIEHASRYYPGRTPELPARCYCSSSRASRCSLAPISTAIPTDGARFRIPWYQFVGCSQTHSSVSHQSSVHKAAVCAVIYRGTAALSKAYLQRKASPQPPVHIPLPHLAVADRNPGTILSWARPSARRWCRVGRETIFSAQRRAHSRRWCAGES